MDENEIQKFVASSHVEEKLFHFFYLERPEEQAQDLISLVEGLCIEEQDTKSFSCQIPSLGMNVTVLDSETKYHFLVKTKKYRHIYIICTSAYKYKNILLNNFIVYKYRYT